MNLTSKRMLQFITGCAGAFALSVTAGTTYVSDHFEYVGEGQGTTNGVVDMPIGAYKCQPWGESSEYTNFQWFADADDVSKLVAEVQNYVGTRPLTAPDTNLVLNLETNGKTLVRTNNVPVDFSVDPVYVDTLIKFTPSEDNPTISDASVKAAVFLDANLHLWVYHGVDSAGGSPTSSDTGLVVSTNEWHRLTILLNHMPNYSDLVFKVFVDGNPVSCAAGMDDDYYSPGPWFYSASIEGSFAAVAFQGTGLVDELVVTEDVPPGFGVPPSVWLTLSFDSAQVSVLTNGIAIAPNDSVQDNTAVSILAKPWYQITDGGALLVNATTNVFDTTTAITGLVGTVTGTAGQTNTVSSEAFSSTTGLPTGFGSVNISSLMAWATANGVTPEGLTDAMLNDYLLNVAPATDAGIEITSITHGETQTTIRIEATKTGVNFTTINGVLNIWTADTLPGTLDPIIRSVDFTFTSETGYIDVVIENGAGSFMKASIDISEAEGIP